MNRSARPLNPLVFQKPKMQLTMPPPPPPKKTRLEEQVGLYFEHLAPNVDEALLASYIDSAGFRAVSIQVEAIDSLRFVHVCQ